jgi:hypothetical protein
MDLDLDEWERRYLTGVQYGEFRWAYDNRQYIGLTRPNYLLSVNRRMFAIARTIPDSPAREAFQKKAVTLMALSLGLPVN